MGRGERTKATEIVPGTLDMLVLRTVNREKAHGYAIAQSIQQLSEQVLTVEEGALYPALHRLEVRGLLRSEWGLSDNNRRAKYYSLTAEGRRELLREAAAWHRVSTAMALIMEGI